MKKISLRILLVLSVLLGLVNSGSVWAEASNEEPMADIKIEQWKGHSFTFLSLPADKQSDGYDVFTEEHATEGFQGTRSLRIPYASHVGKQVTVTEVVPFDAGNHQKDYMVHMIVNNTGEKLIGRSLRGQLEGLVLTADLENAKKQFLGKTIYLKSRELSGLYVYGMAKVPQAVSTTIGYPVKVVDVYAGNQSQEPIWLIISVNEEKAILPIGYSWTNMPIEAWTQYHPWQRAFFTEDPRNSLGGSYDLWNQIQTGNVEAGMNKGQVDLSWGKPIHTEENDSVWIYGTKKLIFDGDVLSSIEDFSESI